MPFDNRPDTLTLERLELLSSIAEMPAPRESYRAILFHIAKPLLGRSALLS